MNYISTLLITLLLAVPAMAVELFRYRGAARDGGTLEYVFETDEKDLPQTVSKEKVAEIAANFMTTFYHIHPTEQLLGLEWRGGFRRPTIQT
jgi:hypothetical protein